MAEDVNGWSLLWKALKDMPRALRAARRHGRAIKLHRQGRHSEAWVELSAALESLRQPEAFRGSPGAAAIIVEGAKLLDAVARELGKPAEAVQALEEALAMVRAEIGSSGGPVPDVLAKDEAWFSARLAELPRPP